MKKNLLRFFAGILLTAIVGGILMNYKKGGNILSEETVSGVTNIVPFEKKEKCLAFFDKYRDYLKENYEWDYDDTVQYISEYEMFYNSELDSCISAYALRGHEKDSDGKTWPTYNYFIVDYLNGEKELYHCFENTYQEHLSGIPTKGGIECGDGFRDLKEKYKN